jgi:hypothetical protein
MSPRPGRDLLAMPDWAPKVCLLSSWLPGVAYLACKAAFGSTRLQFSLHSLGIHQHQKASTWSLSKL